MSFHVLVRGLKFINNSVTKMPQLVLPGEWWSTGGWGLSAEMTVNEYRAPIMTPQNTSRQGVGVEGCDHKHILSSLSLHLPLDYVVALMDCLST